MRSGKPLEHLSEEQLLAYLDGEMSLARTRSARNHLKVCWKCRSLLAELETQIGEISRLFSARTKIDTDRSSEAKEKFLQWRDNFEAQQRLLPKFLPSQLSLHQLHITFTKHRPIALKSQLA